MDVLETLNIEICDLIVTKCHETLIHYQFLILNDCYAADKYYTAPHAYIFANF